MIPVLSQRQIACRDTERGIEVGGCTFLMMMVSVAAAEWKKRRGRENRFH